jgi:hypothetical protein
MGVGIMATSAPPMVEYALTKGANAQEAVEDAPSITVSLSDNTVLTIRRTSVDIRSDICVWRGAVETTGAPAPLMRWPGGKMTGTVEHEGRIYSIRHMGGDMQAIVEMAEERMPPEHAAMTSVGVYFVMRVWTYLVFAETRLDIASHALSPAEIEWFRQTLAGDFRVVLNILIFALLLIAACIPPWHVRDDTRGEAYAH